MSQILMGSIGWEDEDDYSFLGSEENDGHTLVRVQLFEGRDHTKTLNPDRAQGQRIICHLSGGMFRIPPKDTRVLVAIPNGMDHVVGAGLIIASYERSPTNQFSNTRAKMDFGPDVDLVIKARSVTVTDYENQQVSLSPEGGVQAFDKDGAGIQFKSGACYSVSEKCNIVVQTGGTVSACLKMTPLEASLMGGAGCMIKNKLGTTTIASGICSIDSYLCQIGKGATINTQAAVINTPVTGSTPQPSNKVFIAQ